MVVLQNPSPCGQTVSAFSSQIAPYLERKKERESEKSYFPNVTHWSERVG